MSGQNKYSCRIFVFDERSLFLPNALFSVYSGINCTLSLIPNIDWRPSSSTDCKPDQNFLGKLCLRTILDFILHYFLSRVIVILVTNWVTFIHVYVGFIVHDNINAIVCCLKFLSCNLVKNNTLFVLLLLIWPQNLFPDLPLNLHLFCKGSVNINVQVTREQSEMRRGEMQRKMYSKRRIKNNTRAKAWQ